MVDLSIDWKKRAVNFQQEMFLYFGNRLWDKLNREQLQQKVLLAINGIPTAREYSDEENKRAQDLIEFIFSIMRRNGICSDYILFAVVFIYMKTEKGESVYPIFRLDKYNNGGVKNLLFIEWHTKRVYEGWSDYLKCNKLPQCQICYPKVGIYLAESNVVVVKFGKFPKNDTTDAVIDFGSKAVGIAGPALSGISVFVPVVVPELLIGGIIVTALGVAVNGGRSLFRIIDGTRHGQSVNKLECANVVLNVVGGIAAGGQMAMATLIKTAFLQGILPTVALLGLNCAQIAFSGLGITICLLDFFIKYKNNELHSIDWFKLTSIFLFIGNIAINVTACKQLIPMLLEDYDQIDSLFNMVKNAGFSVISDVIQVDNSVGLPMLLRNVLFGSSAKFVSLQTFQIDNVLLCAQYIKNTFDNILSSCASLSVFQKIQHGLEDELSYIDQLFIKLRQPVMEQYAVYKNCIEMAYRTQFWKDIVINNEKIFQSSPVHILKYLWSSLERVTWLLPEYKNEEIRQMQKELVNFTNEFAELINCRTTEQYISAMNFACCRISRELQQKSVLSSEKKRISLCNDILFELKIKLSEIAQDYCENNNDQQFSLQGLDENPVLQQKDINLYLDSLNPDSLSLSRDQCFRLASKFTKKTPIDLENCSLFGKLNNSQFIIVEDKTFSRQTKFTIILFSAANGLVTAGETFQVIQTE